MAYTLEDFIKLNPQYKKRYDPTARTGYVSNIGSGKEISFGLGAGQQYGLGGVEGGSHAITDVDKLIAALSGNTPVQNKPVQPAPAYQQPTYQSPYSEQIGQTLAAIQNRPAFSYNPTSDVGLQTAQETAMDAVSRAAARRGMLYSAGNKAQMGEAALQLVPQFEQTAYNRYAQQGQDTYSQLNTLNALESQAYNKYRDVAGDTWEQYKMLADQQAEQQRIQAAQEAEQQRTQADQEAEAAKTAWERYKWENMSPAEQQKMLMEQDYGWQKETLPYQYYKKDTLAPYDLGATPAQMLPYQYPTMGQSLDAEKWAQEYPLKAAQTEYNINKPYSADESGSFDSGTTNAVIAQLYKFYAPDLANRFIEGNTKSWASNGVDMDKVMKAFKAKWPDYRAGS